MAREWDMAMLRARAAARWAPQTGVEASQGDPFRFVPGMEGRKVTPLDPGVNLAGWINPYSFTLYQVPLSTTVATQVAPPNLRRTYLIMQNQGPGNVFVNFGQGATQPVTLGAPANCLQLITTQFYEQIGGGAVNQQGFPVPSSFVTPDYVSAITDTSGTTMIIGEGVFLISRLARWFTGV